MKKTLSILLILLTVFVLFGCEEKHRDSAMKTVNEGQSLLYQIDTTQIIQIGSHFYIPLSISGTPDENAGIILNALDAFEKSQKRAKTPMEIISWKIEKRQKTGGDTAPSDFVYGLWVDCKPIIMEEAEQFLNSKPN